MAFSFRGLRQALWGGGGEPTIVEVGDGLLEMQISVDPATVREAGAWLQQHHKDRYMVWSLVHNLDEEAFDNGVQDGTSLVSQTPLLEDLLKICHAIRAWIDCDEGNVAFILSTQDTPIAVACTFICCAHLLFSRKETSAERAWRFLWQQRALATQGVQDFLLDEEEAAAKGRVDLPLSHKTYLNYLEELAQHFVLCRDPVFIKRIVMHSIPRVPSVKPPGCCPVVTIASARTGRLLYSSDWRTGPDAPPKTCHVDDLSVIFPVEVAVMGDVVIKVQHRDAIRGSPGMGHQDFDDKGKGGRELASFALHSSMIYYHCLGGVPSVKPEQVYSR
jgi:hypothetical protein